MYAQCIHATPEKSKGIYNYQAEESYDCLLGIKNLFQK